jgi:hypothetical protein
MDWVKQDHVIANGVFADDDSRGRVVRTANDCALAIRSKAFTNVNLVPVAGGVPLRPVSFLANVYANTIAWSRDGTYLLFDTNQRTEDGRLARVDLTLRTPKFREDLFRDLFSAPMSPRPPQTPPPATPPSTPAPATPAAPAPPSTAPAAAPAPASVEPVFADIRQRLSLVPVGLDVDEVTISPDGKMAAIVATAGGRGTSIRGRSTSCRPIVPSRGS